MALCEYKSKENEHAVTLKCYETLPASQPAHSFNRSLLGGKTEELEQSSVAKDEKPLYIPVGGLAIQPTGVFLHS